MTQSIENKSLHIKFFVLVIISTWIPWLIAAISHQKQGDLLVNILIVLGGIGPTFGALFMLYKSNQIDNLKKDYWKRVFDFTGIKGNYYAFIFLFLPLVIITSVLVSLIFGEKFSQLTKVSDDINGITGLIFFAVFILFFGPIPEELGWRGIGLDLLTEKFNKIKASLILGSIWGIWHLPLFFIEGTYQNTDLFNPLGLFIYLGTIIPNTLILTWLYYKTNRSILAAILYHFMINFSGSIIEISNAAQLILLGILSITVLLLIKRNKKFWGIHKKMQKHKFRFS